MSHHPEHKNPSPRPIVIAVVVLILIGSIAMIRAVNPPSATMLVGSETATEVASATSASPLLVNPTPTQFQVMPTRPVIKEPQPKSPTPTPTEPTRTPTATPSPTVTPTPTLDLSKCNVAGCGVQAAALPTVAYHFNLLLTENTPKRRVCPECPKNEYFSEAELNTLVGADRATLTRLRTIALSQEPYKLAPGIIYIVADYVHHVVVDLKESGYSLRNIIPNTAERGTLITPSYCFSPESLVVMTADYHSLVGSNKTETGRDIFFHLGRAALFQRDGRFDIDVIRERRAYDRTTISWGGGPIFMWNGRYDYNPEQEWFEPDALEHYRDTRWAKTIVALSQNRRYLFLSVSYGITLEEYAEHITKLGQKWGMKVDRAMIFDGNESSYMAIRLGNYMVPVLNLEEPLIVNCLAIERAE